MKRTASILSSILLLLISTGCTQPNGHIGKLFGSWILVEMTENGEPFYLPENAEGSSLSFQGELARFSLIFNPVDVENHFARWSRSESLLTFNFNNYSDSTPPGTGGYSAPSWLRMSGLENTYVVTRLDGGHLEFTGDDADGNTFVYRYERGW